MYDGLITVAEERYGDIILRSELIGRRAGIGLKLRLFVIDGTFIDVWLSPDLKRYSYHWEQRALRGKLHRHDNAPDHPHIATHPKHFHNGSEEAIEASLIPDPPHQALAYFLDFVRHQLKTEV